MTNMGEQTIKDFLEAEGFNSESKFYRYTTEKHLMQADDGGIEIEAHPAPTEMIVDFYGSGHAIMAKDIGPGLAVTKSADNEYKDDNRKCAEIRLGDVIEQGGLIYEDQSSYEDGTWFFTIPTGKVRVEIIDQ